MFDCAQLEGRTIDGTLPETLGVTDTPPRAIGAAKVAVRLRNGQSVLADLHQSGSMRVLFPRPATPPTAMLLNTAGGITGGDRFCVALEVAEGAQLTTTTQAAERAYAAMPGPPGQLSTTIKVAASGVARWLPQETILFDNSDLERNLSVGLEGDARALIVEPLVFGRSAHGEKLTRARFRDHVEIRRDGRVIYADRITLDGDISAHLEHPAHGSGAGAMVSLVLAEPDAARHVETLRALAAENSGNCPKTRIGISAPAPDLLVLRGLAHDSFDLRQVLLPLLDHLTGNELPICWRL